MSLPLDNFMKSSLLPIKQISILAFLIKTFSMNFLRLFISLLIIALTYGNTLAQTIPSAPNQRNAQGQRVGEWVITYTHNWDKTDIRDSIAYYRRITFDSKGRPQGKTRDYYRNGALQFEGVIVQLEPEEIAEDLCIWYYENGNKSKEVTLVNNVEEGLLKTWFENGKPQSQYEAKNGVPEGVVRIWNERSDSTKFYYENGQRVDLSKLNDEIVAHFKQANYAQATPLAEKCLKIGLLTLGEEDPEYATFLNNLAALYKNQGFFEKAEPLYVQSLLITKKTLGELHPEYAKSLNNLAGLYQMQGKYNKAEPLFEQAVQVFEKSLGANHPDYARALTGLAVVYFNLGQYKKAEVLYEKSMIIYKMALGENHPDYASSLNNLALVYETQGQYDKAEPFYEKSVAIRKMVLGERHPEYAMSLVNLAALYRLQRKYSKVESLYKKALLIFKNSVGENHPYYATALNDLAIFYKETNNLNAAVDLYEEEMKIYKSIYGEANADYATSLNNLAILYYTQRHYKNAALLLDKGYQIDKKNLVDYFDVASPQQQAEYLQKADIKNHIIYSLGLNSNKPNRIASWAYEHALFIKGLQLQTGLQFENFLRQSKDTTLTHRYGQFQNFRRVLNDEMAKPIAERQGVFELESQIEDLYKDLSRGSAEFRNFKASIQLTYQDIQKRLQPNEAAIEFVHFPYHNGERWSETPYYVAIVLRSGWPAPRMVKLFEEQELRHLLQPLQDSTFDFQKVASLYRGPGVISLTKNNTQAALYDLIWKPLEGLLTDVKTVHYSPSGLLHRLSMSAITTPTGQLLHDKYTLNYLTSTRELATQTTPFQLVKAQSVALFGGINYTADSVALQTAFKFKQNSETLAQSDAGSANKPNRNSRGKEWGFLSGTASEVANISQLCQNAQLSTNLFTADAASEENLKALAASGQSPQILHIASHGFFYADSAQQKAQDFERRFLGEQQVRYAVNPLERSGLVLAGANHYWRTGKPYGGLEDGILKASEVATMNLINTQLVVLSACETGLGDINGSEGVFGLQRAFKMAGVKYILMSLWQVPDAKTAEMMQAFYRNLFKGQPIEVAFRSAQNTLRQNPKSTPYEWAGFVLIK
jgi:CHAT domain-containing protein/antitoxin component YwqK of YwqJK toxin-antitoxin module/Flp pilus assembly protein TadD